MISQTNYKLTVTIHGETWSDETGNKFADADAFADDADDADAFADDADDADDDVGEPKGLMRFMIPQNVILWRVYGVIGS